VEREDLWLAVLRRNPGRTEQEFISLIREPRQFVPEMLLRRADLAARLLRDRVLGESDPTSVRAWLMQAEDAGHVKRTTRQMSCRPEPEEYWSIAPSGDQYLVGRGIR
jgi:hypothetical protein